MAVAATAEAEGAAEAEVKIARDVVTEPSLPRFAAPGDIFSAPCRLFNMTDKPIEVTFTAESLDESTLVGWDVSARDYKKADDRAERLRHSPAEVPSEGRGRREGALHGEMGGRKLRFG